MSKSIILLLRLAPEFRGMSPVPDQTVFFDATAATELGVPHEIESLGPLTFEVEDTSKQMRGVLFSLETPTGSIIRLTRQALRLFDLKHGRRYWMEWDNATRTLHVIRRVEGK